MKLLDNLLILLTPHHADPSKLTRKESRFFSKRKKSSINSEMHISKLAHRICSNSLMPMELRSWAKLKIRISNTERACTRKYLWITFFYFYFFNNNKKSTLKIIFLALFLSNLIRLVIPTETSIWETGKMISSMGMVSTFTVLENAMKVSLSMDTSLDVARITTKAQWN